jgi:hypothetical protein
MPGSATPEMCEAGWNAVRHRVGDRGVEHLYRDVHMSSIYDAMYAAAPACDLVGGRGSVRMPCLTDMDCAGIVGRAFEFAERAHRNVGQLRKYTCEPYFVHPVEVANLVAQVPHTDAMLAAALLHDTVEDTAVTLEEIDNAFGPAVASLVGWLTDVSRPEDGNRSVRMARNRAHISQAPAAAMTIKLADVISNSQSIIAYDAAFARVYLPEKALLLEVLRDGDPALWERANRLLQNGLKLLSGGK